MKTNSRRSRWAALTFIFSVMLLSHSLSAAEWETINTETFDDEKFIFPTDLKAKPLALLFLAMSSDRDNGQLQQKQQIEWHKALSEAGVLTAAVTPYHFPVMKSPPFFVKGIISSAMAEAYEGTVPTQQSGILYVDDLSAFAKKANLTLDDKPTLVLVAADGSIIAEFKGTVNADTLAAIKSSIAEHTTGTAITPPSDANAE